MFVIKPAFLLFYRFGKSNLNRRCGDSINIYHFSYPILNIDFDTRCVYVCMCVCVGGGGGGGGGDFCLRMRLVK